MSEAISGISRIKLSDYHVPQSIIVEKNTLQRNFPFHWHEEYG